MSGSKLFLAVTAALLVGCFRDLGPAPATEPSTVAGPSLSLSPAEQLAAELARIQAEKAAQQVVYKQLLKDWNDGQRAARLGMAQDPTQTLELLACPPIQYHGTAQIVGPEGGVLNVGPHRLVIPPGALSSPVMITAEAKPAQYVALQFSPHGLEFARAAAISLNYNRCEVSASVQLLVAYVGSEAESVEVRPSLQRKANQLVEATVDHFSNYAVAYRK